MKYRINAAIFLAVLLTVGSVDAQIHYQTRSTTTVGPGMVHKHIVVPEKFWNLNVLEIDLKNPYLRLETIKALDACVGRETTSSMAQRRSYSGHQVVGAINGDFFNPDGFPINVQVINGQMLRNPIAYSAIGFDAANHPVLQIVHFSGSVSIASAGQSIAGVNKAREADQVVLYNSYFGSSTATNNWGVEVLLTPLSEWSVNETVRCRVEKKENYAGNMSFGSGQVVLSAHGTAIPFFDNHVHAGDEVNLQLELTPSIPKLKEMISGWCKIVDKGINYVQEGYENESGPPSTFAVHPRTAVGFSADSSRLYMVTVDGRNPDTYVGMTLPELADFLVSIGVAYGLNLDGGGSTTMVIRGEVKNHPSDATGERAVGNALLAVSSAPAGSLGAIQIEPDYINVSAGEQITFEVSGWDEHYNPFPIVEMDIDYRVDSDLGTISDEGIFIASENTAEGFLYTNYEGYRDSAFIQINTGTDLENNLSDNFTAGVTLYQNHPNPFGESTYFRGNHGTTISFETSRSEYIEMDVFDLSGRNVASLIAGWLDQGKHQVEWNPAALASGIYVCCLRSGSDFLSRKMLFLK